jgi:hyperosmotically inducible protein
MSMDDEDIDKQIVDQLYWDNRVKASDVAVTVDKGWVTLKGEVPSYQAKVTAAEDAYLVRGVKFVDNKITVTYPSFPTDKELKENVETALNWDFDIDDSKITVSVDVGTVKLLGTVDSYWKKMLAEDDAFRMTGVTDVRNELAIVMTDSWTDEMIALDIEEALRRNLNVEVNDVDVKVGKGKVTLSGEVPDWTARYAADTSALYTSGVKSVHNMLSIA